MNTDIALECKSEEIERLRARNTELENELSETYRSVVELTLELEKAHKVVDHASRLADIVALSVTLAHNINNALQGIIGPAELGMERTSKDSPTFELFETVREEGLRIRDVLIKLSELHELKTTDYVRGTQMLDFGDTSETS